MLWILIFSLIVSSIIIAHSHISKEMCKQDLERYKQLYEKYFKEYDKCVEERDIGKSKLDNMTENCSEKLEEITKCFEDKISKISNLEARILCLDKQLKDKCKDIDCLKEENCLKENEVLELSNKLGGFMTELEDCRTRETNVSSSLEAKCNEVDGLKRALEIKCKEANDNIWAQEELNKKCEEIEELKRRIGELQDEVESLRKGLCDYHDELKVKEAEIDRLKCCIKFKDEKIASLERQKTDCQGESDQLRNIIVCLRQQIDQLRNIIVCLRQQIDNLNNNTTENNMSNNPLVSSTF